LTENPTNRNLDTPTAAIEVSQLTVSYGPVPALLDISVTIEPGKLVGVIGPNGLRAATRVGRLGFPNNGA
jgi:ABC-type branched-subunit amino acid transport system ATPase component